MVEIDKMSNKELDSTQELSLYLVLRGFSKKMFLYL